MDHIIQKILTVTAAAWQIRFEPRKRPAPNHPPEPHIATGLNLLGMPWALIKGWAC